MKGLDDSAWITQVSIPGTHESAATHGHLVNAACQTLSIREQLKRGIRFLDIRLYIASYGLFGALYLEATHSVIEQYITFKKIQEQVITFLAENPSEFVLMNVQMYDPKLDSKGGPEVFSKVFDQEVADYKDYYWHFDQSKMSLGKTPVARVRGKIILIQAYDEKSGGGWSSDKGIPWNGFTYAGYSQNKYFDTQNFWEAQLKPKIVAIKETLEKEQNWATISLNFLSYAPGGSDPLQTGPDVNAWVLDELRMNPVVSPKSHQLGVIIMDSAGIPNTSLIEEIITHNVKI